MPGKFKNYRKFVALLVGAYVVIATYTLWAFMAYHGDTINVVFAGLAAFIVMAGAMAVFGAERMNQAVELTREARTVMHEARKMKENGRSDDETDD